jgi:hypothetical protein
MPKMIRPKIAENGHVQQNFSTWPDRQKTIRPIQWNALAKTWPEKIFIVDHNQTVRRHLQRIKTHMPVSPRKTLALICLHPVEMQRFRKEWERGQFLSSGERAKAAAALPVGPLDEACAHPRPSAPPSSRSVAVLLIKIRGGKAKKMACGSDPQTPLPGVHRWRFRCGDGGGPEQPQARVHRLRDDWSEVTESRQPAVAPWSSSRSSPMHATIDPVWRWG